jgi:hypothetical protein
VRIISGGQTGVDRAALDVAVELGIPCGGWCPRGRKAEDGRIPDRYPLTETESDRYTERTRRNVKESEATLILTRGPMTGGTGLTFVAARFHHKPVYVVDLSQVARREQFVIGARMFLGMFRPETLNVAGPRESKCPGIYEQARSFLLEALRS